MVDCTFNHFFYYKFFFPSTTSLFLLLPLRVWYSIVTEGQSMVRVSFFFLFFFSFLFSLSSTSFFFSFPFQHRHLLFHLLILLLHTKYFFVINFMIFLKGTQAHLELMDENWWSQRICQGRWQLKRWWHGKRIRYYRICQLKSVNGVLEHWDFY